MFSLHTMLRSAKQSLRSIQRNHHEYFRYGITLAIGLLVVFAALYAFLDIAEALAEDQIAQFDNALSAPVLASRNATATVILRSLTHLGDVVAYITMMLAAVVYFYFRRHNWILSVQIAIVLATTGTINIALKNIIGRARPAGEHLVVVSAQSFPSGHSMSSIAFYGFLIYIAWHYLPRLWMKVATTVVLSVLVATIGFSRVYLGVHYPSDVAAGFAAGLGWLVVCILAFRTLRLYTSRKHRNAKQ